MAFAARPRGGGRGRFQRHGHHNGSQPQQHHRVLRNRDHGCRLLGNLSDLRDKGKFCDVELLLEGKTFVGHRAVLAASSPYFEAMFSTGLTEGSQRSIEICGIAPSIFEQLIAFIYKGTFLVAAESNTECAVYFFYRKPWGNPQNLIITNSSH